MRGSASERVICISGVHLFPVVAAVAPAAAAAQSRVASTGALDFGGRECAPKTTHLHGRALAPPKPLAQRPPPPHIGWPAGLSPLERAANNQISVAKWKASKWRVSQPAASWSARELSRIRHSNCARERNISPRAAAAANPSCADQLWRRLGCEKSAH